MRQALTAHDMAGKERCARASSDCIHIYLHMATSNQLGHTHLYEHRQDENPKENKKEKASIWASRE